MRPERKSTAGNGSPEQQPAQTTIGGERLARGRREPGNVPRGIEVLIKKASVDSDFRTLLLETRAEAAQAIDLVLDPHEATIIGTIAEEYLAATIAKTEVPQEHRRAFLGSAAAAMLAALAGGQEISGAQVNGGGFGGFAANLDSHSTDRAKVIAFVSKQLDLQEDAVTRRSFLRDLAKEDAEREALRKALEDHFDVSISDDDFDRMISVGILSDRIADAIEVKPNVLQVIAKKTGVPAAKLKHSTSLTEDLRIDRGQLVDLRRDLGRRLRVYLDWGLFKHFETVGEVVNYAGQQDARRRQAQQQGEKK